MQLRNHLAVGCPGNAAVNKEGATAQLDPIGSTRLPVGRPTPDRLKRYGGHRKQELAHVGTASGLSDRSLHGLAPAATNRGTDQRAEIWLCGLTGRVRRCGH